MIHEYLDYLIFGKQSQGAKILNLVNAEKVEHAMSEFAELVEKNKQRKVIFKTKEHPFQKKCAPRLVTSFVSDVFKGSVRLLLFLRNVLNMF